MIKVTYLEMFDYNSQFLKGMHGTAIPNWEFKIECVNFVNRIVAAKNSAPQVFSTNTHTHTSFLNIKSSIQKKRLELVVVANKV